MPYTCKCQCANFREHALGVTVSPSAMPSRSGGQAAADTNAREARMQKDLPAYKRLREEGLQPKNVMGSATFEAKAVDRVEIEDGHLYGADKLSIVHDVKDVLAATA